MYNETMSDLIVQLIIIDYWKNKEHNLSSRSYKGQGHSSQGYTSRLK